MSVQQNYTHNLYCSGIAIIVQSNLQSYTFYIKI